jgi:hypothetical protein
MSAEAVFPAIKELDLSLHSVMKHFAQSKNERLVNFLVSLDQIDTWAVDRNEDICTTQVRNNIAHFLALITLLLNNHGKKLYLFPGEFSTIMSHLTTSRCLYLLRYLEQTDPKFFSSLANLLADRDNQSEDLACIAKRIDAFTRASLLSEIFSAGRLQEIALIMKNYRV